MTDLLARLDDIEAPYRTRSVLHDLAMARGNDRESIKRLVRAKVLRQAPAGSTLMSDVPGLVSHNPLPITARARRLIDARSAGARRLIDALVSDTLPTGSRPWIPQIPAPTPAQVQQGEKTSVTLRTLTVEGGLVVPDTIGAATDISWSDLMDPGVGDILTALVLSDLAAGIAAYLAGALEANAAEALSLAQAVASVEGAGWPCDLIVASHASLADFVVLHPEAGSWGGIPIVYSPAAPATFAVSLAGLYAATSATDLLRVTEPSIGGFQLGAVAGVVVEAAPGAVAAVSPGPPTITGLQPAGGAEAGGTGVRITGTGLTHATGVTFGGNPALGVQVVTGGLITCISPPGQGTVPVTVAHPLGDVSRNYAYIAAGAEEATTRRRGGHT